MHPPHARPRWLLRRARRQAADSQVCVASDPLGKTKPVFHRRGIGRRSLRGAGNCPPGFGRVFGILVLGGSLFGLSSLGENSRGAAPGDDPSSEAFFEKRIRPVLIKHCYGCHSAEADEVGGALWLDSADSMQRGGESGPSILPGDASASLLVSAIRYESSEMPPDQPLPEEVVRDFVAWIDAGAIDPRESRPGSEGPVLTQGPSIDLEKGREFWAFRPLSDYRDAADAPERGFGRERMIDDCLDRAIMQAGIVPRGSADAETRLRRLAFDLTGLPPSETLRERWLQSPSEATWQSVVDELLGSRAFAQHWGRHWMDVARYADSNGSDFNATFHDAWRYRDYLIDAFDRDQPIDQMIRQQVAGDLLPARHDRERHDNLVATTFLMLGPKMLSERAKDKLILDVVDEQIDTVGRAFLGMTLGCARCHDHKFDPIPTEDYYALAGIFRSTRTLNGESQKYVSTWNRVPLPVDPEHQQAIKEHTRNLKSLAKEIEAVESALAEARSSQHPGIVVDDSEALKTGKWTHSTLTKGFVGKGYLHDHNGEKGKRSIEFRTKIPRVGRYEVRFAFSAGSNRAAGVPVTVKNAKEEIVLTVNQTEKNPSPPWFTLGTFDFDPAQDAVVTVSNAGTAGYVIADAVSFIPMDPAEPQRSSEEIEAIARQVEAGEKQLAELQRAQKELKENSPEDLPFAMAPGDLPGDQVADSPVQIRGEVHNRGELVPRGFLQVCANGDASIESPLGSGRLELAAWLTDPDHPLVARVMVNRVWGHLFGEGIVRTVDNFGTRGDRPSHPELLDALAIDFMRGGWRLKPLIRQIVLSQAYNRSSQFDAESAGVDPANRLLWRSHRKRLPAEAIRDAMLVAAGQMTQEEPGDPVGDKGVLVTKNVATTGAVSSGIERPVRTVYLPVIRGYVSPLLTALDMADPDLLVGKRPTTNVPGQTLVLINHEQVNAWAVATADRLWEADDSWDQRVKAVYRVCLSREPTVANLEAARHYLGVDASQDSADQDSADQDSADQDGGEQRERYRDLVAAVFASTEFRMTD